LSGRQGGVGTKIACRRRSPPLLVRPRPARSGYPSWRACSPRKKGGRAPSAGPAAVSRKLAQSLRRQALGSAYALRPGRIGDLSAMGALLLREALAGSRALPYPIATLAQPDGLCGIARDLSVATLGEAYSRGLYPWSHAGPVKWWAPRTRCVGNPREIAVGEAMRRHARRGTLKFTFDRDFDAVIAACAAPRPGHLPLTWIAPKLCGLTRRCTTPVSPIPMRSGTIAASLLPAVTAWRAAASLSGRACSPASQAQARSGSRSSASAPRPLGLRPARCETALTAFVLARLQANATRGIRDIPVAAACRLAPRGLAERAKALRTALMPHARMSIAT
jgi:hypothetical protein